MSRDKIMSDNAAFECLCLVLNHDPRSTSWEVVVGDVIKLTEFMSLMTSFTMMQQLPTNLLAQMRDVVS